MQLMMGISMWKEGAPSPCRPEAPSSAHQAQEIATCHDSKAPGLERGANHLQTSGLVSHHRWASAETFHFFVASLLF